MRILHAIHDFLPHHAAGSELYAFHLCRELARRHEVWVLCAEYDPTRPHGHLTRRQHEGLPVLELVNNWDFRSLAESYRSPVLNRELANVLDELRPQVLHVHNLLNLSFDLPALARARGISTVATLHDFTLVCPSGGQRVHLAEEHVCHEIDTQRCSRCFPQSPFYGQMAFGQGHRAPPPLVRAVRAARRVVPFLRGGQSVSPGPVPITPREIEARLDYARRAVLETVDLFVAPSGPLAADFERFGLPRDKILVSDYGFVPFEPAPGPPSATLRIGFVGTLVWHKGPHVLLEAARRLPAGRFEVCLFGDPQTFPGYVEGLKQRAEGLPVRFMGPFANERARDVYAQMDVLVVPSLWPENSPLVIHEAFMAGVPVVGSDMGGIPDLLGHGAHGTVYEAFSPDRLAQALCEFIDDPARLRRLAGALPRVKSIEEDAAAWEAVYRQVLSGRSAGAAAS